ncbi:MAG: arylesterase [Glaciecola sp.]|jgi:acyl-CoA thioesterase I
MKILSLYGWLLCVVFSTASYAAIDQSTSTASNTQTETQTVLILGDSLSAAYGLTQEEGWVSLLQNMLSQSADPTLSSLTLINASISGETTDGGLARLARLLTQHNPDHILIELGGNDGLQGHNIKKLKNNLRAIVKQSQSANVQVAIQQMQIPTNYGARYNRMFISAFSDVADEFDVPLVPFFLADIALNPELMQNDGIHPTAEAQPMIAEFMLTHWITPLVALY